MNDYTYRVGWSAPHGEYIGTCLELPHLWRKAPTAQEATVAIEAAVDEHVALLQEYGDTPPTPIADRNFSGTIVVRTSPGAAQQTCPRGRRAGGIDEPMGGPAAFGPAARRRPRAVGWD